MNLLTRLMDWIAILRPVQWYKNTLLFLAPFFAVHAIAQTPWSALATGFACFCAISSANYILNDVWDRKADRAHPTKKDRPIASGRIQPMQATITAVLLFLAGLGGAVSIHPLFGISALALFAVSIIYSTYFKHHRYWDIFGIATNFVIRASAGTFIIEQPLSPWLVACVFLLALFLALAKRRSEQFHLSENGRKHRATLARYKAAELDALLKTVAAIVVLSYGAYCLHAIQTRPLLFSAPFIAFGLHRYYSLMHDEKWIPMAPEKMIADGPSVISLLAWFISVFVVLYLI